MGLGPYQFMKSLLKRWFASSARHDGGTRPGAIATLDGRTLDLSTTAHRHEGVPHPDWEVLDAWIQAFPEEQQEAAVVACQQAWLGMLADALGEQYRVFSSARALVLSHRPDNEASAALEFVDRTQRRVQHMLEELAGSDGRKEILLVFADADAYSRYARHYVPDLDETMVSAGMYLMVGGGHFIVFGDELWRQEPTIVHELTHAQLSHLPLPLWLNEGMAVNAEQRLTRIGADVWEVKALERKHAAFWTPETIQEFWNGAAFKRPDEGSELAYDLARVLVTGMCADWASFKRFAAEALADDGGAEAAANVLGVDLGEAVRHFLERDDGEWGPHPEAWEQGAVVEPE
jgi:hypothetical protein